MSMITIIFRKALSAILFVVNIFKRLIGLFWRKKESNIGELPFIAPTAVISGNGGGQRHDPYQSHHQQQPHANYPTPQQTPNSWNSWSDTAFGVESKIEEYRRKQAEALQKQKLKEKDIAAAEPDYFNDLKPEIRATKRVQIDKGRPITPIPRKNLFEFNENEVDVPVQSSHELGDLDLDGPMSGSNGASSAWDEFELNVEDFDQAVKAQKQQERAERQKQRLLEHERRHLEKKGRHNH